jgi:hypothetical protein
MGLLHASEYFQGTPGTSSSGRVVPEIRTDHIAAVGPVGSSCLLFRQALILIRHSVWSVETVETDLPRHETF